jgi:hypothetical protein
MFTAMQALEWLRQATVGWNVGESVVRSPVAVSALEAVGLLARRPGPGTVANIEFVPSSAALVDGQRLDVVLCRERRTSSDIEDAAAKRAQSVAQRSGPQNQLHMLIAASSIRGHKPRDLAGVEIVDPDVAPDQLIGGERAVPIHLTYADEVLEAA